MRESDGGRVIKAGDGINWGIDSRNDAGIVYASDNFNAVSQ
jgi:hypothetical protein